MVDPHVLELGTRSLLYCYPVDKQAFIKCFIWEFRDRRMHSVLLSELHIDLLIIFSVHQAFKHADAIFGKLLGGLIEEHRSELLVVSNEDEVFAALGDRNYAFGFSCLAAFVYNNIREVERVDEFGASGSHTSSHDYLILFQHSVLSFLLQPLIFLHLFALQLVSCFTDLVKL